MTGLDPMAAHQASFDPWNFRPDVAVELGGAQLSGDKVEATDGTVGKVLDAKLVPGDSYLVVTTGRWVFGHQTILPAGAVSHVDRAGRKIYLDRSRDQVKGAPEILPDEYDDPTHRDALADYYHATYG
jgi:hypothetical protein